MVRIDIIFRFNELFFHVAIVSNHAPFVSLQSWQKCVVDIIFCCFVLCFLLCCGLLYGIIVVPELANIAKVRTWCPFYVVFCCVVDYHITTGIIVVCQLASMEKLRTRNRFLFCASFLDVL